jgi:dienelactone hydrolase/pimeloyl-ACP methyl ester carboxylesterase
MGPKVLWTVPVGAGFGGPAVSGGHVYLLGGSAMAATTTTETADPTAVKQPAVIGYPNLKGVTIERVTFPARNMGTTIVANLFKPARFETKRKYAAVVVTHPFGGVKEQTSGLYAQRLAEEGLVTLAYDASYQGESGGEPRLMEVPAQRLDDISCAIDFLARHPQVDEDRIGSLGICAGAGYALCNAQTEMRVKAVAAVSTFNLGAARREGMGTISYEERIKRLKDAGAARSREAAGEPVRLVPVVPDSPAGFTESTPQLYRGLRLLPHAAGAAPELSEPVRLLQPSFADGVPSIRAIGDDLSKAAAPHRGIQGRHALLERGGPQEGQGTKGALRDRWSDAHRPVRQGAVRDAGGHEAGGILLPAALPCWRFTVRTAVLRLFAATLTGVLAAPSASRAQALKDVQTPDTPLVLKAQGSFFVGGDKAEQTQVELGSLGPGGHIAVNQMYVRYMVPQGGDGNVPVVMVHGATLTGKSWETTPDGRMGWDEYFVRRGRAVYVPDQVGRGRSGFNQALFNNVRAGTAEASKLPALLRFSDEVVWPNFRFGSKPGEPFPESQFPVAAVDELAKQGVPDVSYGGLPTPNPTFKALSDLARQLNGAVLMGHSQSGRFPLEAALLDTTVTKGLVLVEPGVFPAPYTDEQVKTLAKVPVLVVFGDYRDTPTGISSRRSWQVSFDGCQELIARLKAAGGQAQMLDPAARGIRGGSHMIMQDKNNLQIADLILQWIDERVGKRGGVKK